MGLREINPTTSVFIPQSLILRSIVLGWILISKLVYSQFFPPSPSMDISWNPTSPPPTPKQRKSSFWTLDPLKKYIILQEL